DRSRLTGVVRLAKQLRCHRSAEIVVLNIIQKVLNIELEGHRWPAIILVTAVSALAAAISTLTTTVSAKITATTAAREAATASTALRFNKVVHAVRARVSSSGTRRFVGALEPHRLLHIE